MLPLYGFPWHESGGQPEQEGRSQQAECGERGGTYFSLLHDQFTAGRVDTGETCLSGAFGRTRYSDSLYSVFE